MPSRRSTGRKRAGAIRISRRKQPLSRSTWEFLLPSPLHTDRLGRAIGSALQGGESLALFGPLGAGKTALVRGIAAGLGASSASVSSPTFVLLHEYRGRLPLAHIDLYRLNTTREIESIGAADYLTGQWITAIEWAEKGRDLLPQDRLEVELRHHGVQSRTVRLTASGESSRALLARTRKIHRVSLKHSSSGLPRSPKSKGTSSP